MKEIGSGRHALARIAAPLINGVKRVVAEIGVFTDTKAYKDEIARYEGEIGSTARRQNESARNNEAEEREAAIS